VKVPIAVAEERDPKGLYKKARAGLIKDFTGIDAPYEEPEKPELTIDTSQHDLDESVAIIMDYLEINGIIKSRK
jgi:adenylylsulfate kinase-like enzyme